MRQQNDDHSGYSSFGMQPTKSQLAAKTPARYRTGDPTQGLGPGVDRVWPRGCNPGHLPTRKTAPVKKFPHPKCREKFSHAHSALAVSADYCREAGLSV